MNRRDFLRGVLAVGVAAPAVVRVASLMPIRGRTLLTADATYWVNGFNDEPGDGTYANPWRTLQRALDHINRDVDANGHAVELRLDGVLDAGKVDLGRNITLAVDQCGFCDLSGEIAFDGDRNVIEVRNNSYMSLRELTLLARDPVETGPLLRTRLDEKGSLGFVDRDIVDELNGWAGAIERSMDKVR